MSNRLLILTSSVVFALLAWWTIGPGDSLTHVLSVESPATVEPHSPAELEPARPAQGVDATDRRESAAESSDALLTEDTLPTATAPPRTMSFLVRVEDPEAKPVGRGYPPLADVQVALGIVHHPFQADGPTGATKIELARTRTDVDGIVKLSVDVPGAELPDWIDEAWQYAQMIEPGYAATVETHKSANKIVLRPRRGASISGRVLQQNGEPAPRGEVRVFRAGMGHLSGEPAIRKEFVGRKGSFGISIPTPGVYDLHVSSEGYGARLLRDVPIESNGDPDVIEVRLEAGGAIAGQLVDPDGVPIAGHRLTCVPAAHQNFVERRLPKEVRIPREASGGSWGASVRTDEAGRFSFGGLVEDAYFIRAWSDESMNYGTLLTDHPVEVGTEGLTLSFALHRFFVRVLDHSGSPVDLYADHQPHWLLLKSHALYVEECDAAGRVLQERRHPVERRLTDDDGRLIIPVTAGKRYVLGVLSSDCALVEEVVAVSPGTYRIDVDLHLPEARPDTTLELHVRDTNEIGTDTHHDRIVEIIAPESGRVLVSTAPRIEWWEEPDGVRVSMGPGRYLLRAGRVESESRTDSPEPLPPGTVERIVDVSAGRVTRVELNLLPLPITEQETDTAPQEAPR